MATFGPQPRGNSTVFLKLSCVAADLNDGNHTDPFRRRYRARSSLPFRPELCLDGGSPPEVGRSKGAAINASKTGDLAHQKPGTFPGVR